MPWWGYAASVLGPLIIIAGWTVDADMQPVPFDAVHRSISALASVGMPHRWVITLALIATGTCLMITGLALRPAPRLGRVLLMTGGASTILIAVYPQPRGTGSLTHEAFSLIGLVAMTIWPVAAIRRDPGALPGLRRRPARIATVVLLVIMAWFCVELFNGPQLGLAERTVTTYQAIWPTLVVLSGLAARRSPALAGQQPQVSPGLARSDPG